MPLPLGFFSKKLYKAQLNYSAFDIELLALYLGITHFRSALDGRRFRVQADHKPLTFALHRLSDAWSARQQRQLSYIAEYTSEIEHMPGRSNVVADALSRPPQHAAPVAAVYPSTPDNSTNSFREIAEGQEHCKQTIRANSCPDVRSAVIEWDTVLCLEAGGLLKPLVPEHMWHPLFNKFHIWPMPALPPCGA